MPAGVVGAGCWAAIFVSGSSHVPGVRGHPCAGRRFRRRAGRDPQWSAGDGAAGGLSAWAMDAAIAPAPGAGPPEGVRWAPGRAKPAAATWGALGFRGARSCPPARGEACVAAARAGRPAWAGASRGVWASAACIPGPIFQNWGW